MIETHSPQCNRWRGAIYWDDIPCTCEQWKPKSLVVTDNRTPEELQRDGDDRWPDGTKYIPPPAFDLVRELEMLWDMVKIYATPNPENVAAYKALRAALVENEQLRGRVQDLTAVLGESRNLYASTPKESQDAWHRWRFKVRQVLGSREAL